MFNGLADLLNSPASLRGGAAAGARSSGVIVPVFNDTGADVERFDCLALGDPRFDIVDGKEDLIFDLEAADPDKPAAIAQEPIADTKRGLCCIFGLTVAKVDAGTLTNLRGEPKTGNLLDPVSSGSIVLLSAPSGGATAETLRPVLIGGGSAEGSALLRYVLTSAMNQASGVSIPTGAQGQATATIHSIPSGTSTTNATLYDFTGTAAHQISADEGICMKAGNFYVVVEPECDFESFQPSNGGGE